MRSNLHRPPGHHDVPMALRATKPGPTELRAFAWLLFGASFLIVATAPARAIDEPAKVDDSRSWAFQPIRTPSPPEVDRKDWVRGPIDAFVLRCLEDARLAPAPPAGRLALLRRAYLDLLGLPPPPDEVGRFACDERPDAYERLIDRLLASPQYGERWGRHWLDVARYANTSGFEADHLYPDAWRYRDYVIRSLNSGKPLDRFIQEQVAGDELWPDDPEALAGSTLYCIGPALQESAMVEGQLDYEWLTDSADTTGAAFLGLTFGCARCHDHKYDPIRQVDYFAMQAVFATSDRPYPNSIRLARIKALNGLLSDAPVPEKLLDDPRCTVLTPERAGFRLFHRQAPLTVHRLHRGEVGKPREAVGPAFPAALLTQGRRPDLDQVPPGKRRAALARWLTAPENPLVARVLVNRVWAWHFGRGIVASPNDFGAQGEPPTHPELLDWLASNLIAHGWNLKRLHRQILTSSTYRMSSVASGQGLRDDPDDTLLWHFPRRRLEGEAIRDSMLACSGTLNPRPFGPPVVPPLGKNELTGLFDGRSKWPVTKEPTEHTRRSVYLLVRRTFAYPLFSAFDPPELMVSCPRRMQTIVPTQALALLNSPLARGQASAFARRLTAECGPDRAKAVCRAWLLAFGRPIREQEADHARSFLEARMAQLSSPSARSPEDTALAELCLSLFNANEFIYRGLRSSSWPDMPQIRGRAAVPRLSRREWLLRAGGGFACWALLDLLKQRRRTGRLTARPRTRWPQSPRISLLAPSGSSRCSCREVPATSTPSTPSRCSPVGTASRCRRASPRACSCSSPRGRRDSGLPADFHEMRQVGHRDRRHLPPPPKCCRRSGGRPLVPSRLVQPRPGPVHAQHRSQPDGPSLHGLVGHLRPG